jgi:glycosyltransferase involved in cell wall biosynthesis
LEEGERTSAQIARNDMKKEQFSIVIPALNEEKYLPMLLDDLTKQTFKDFGVIVVDGKSEDATVKRAKKYSNKFTSFEVIISKKRNASYQRNLGAKNAKCIWVLFMDADDRLPACFLEGIKYRLSESNADCFTTYCKADTKKGSDTSLANFINLSMEVSKLLESPTALGALIGVSKKAFNKFGGFDEKVVFAEDIEYIRKLYKKGAEFLLFKDPRYIYSLRRYRKDGKLKYFTKTAKLHLKNFAGMEINQLKEYPMGGASLERKDLNGLTALFGGMKTALKRPKILKKIKEYLSSMEGNY